MIRSHRTLLPGLLAAVLLSAPAVGAPAPDLRALDAVPRQELPPGAVARALEDAPLKNRPYQFAVAIDIALAPALGRWDLDATGAVWRIRLYSAGARSLSASFPDIRLPPGAQLNAYDPAGRVVHGPYRAADVGDGGLWLPLVPGEELVLEARMPLHESDEFDPGPARGYHGFRSWKATGEGEAGACNIDITCSSAAPWATYAGSVAKITIGNAFACSGQLLNNVRQDQRRLFLTAAHCGVDGAAGPADSVVFYFNYVGPCDDGRTNPEPQPAFQTADVLAHDAQADFSLLLITDASPLPAGIYFAGWDATGAGAGSGASIHHPRGDEKKIAFFGSPVVATAVDIGRSCPIDSWQVRWASGTTEVGSSGAALWNEDHRVIGILSGGTADCSNPSGFDYFARLERGWTANARPDGQLKAHLDPEPDSCIASIPGLDPAAPAAPSAITTGPQRCEGPASGACSVARGGGNGGAPGFLPAALLALALRRLFRSPATR